MGSHNAAKTRLGRYAALFALVLIAMPLAAHVVPDEVKRITGTEAAWTYLKLGYTHILPLGLDHILFVLCLFLLSAKLKPIIMQATAFTVAHSVTLGLSLYGVIEPPTRIVEPMIAVSILYVALENIFSPRVKASRLGIVFLFGLIHGMGFATVLSEIGLPTEHFATALVTFNVGVELGQITVILLAYLLVGKWFSDKPYYRQRIVIPLSVLIALTATYWTVERIFFAG
ncbi:MAG: HupE/UreJ family protein [Flavobacteriales bacterium]